MHTAKAPSQVLSIMSAVVELTMIMAQSKPAVFIQDTAN
jgi:hypothetical protein